MPHHFIEDQSFDHKDFSIKRLDVGDFEDCTFSYCNFSNVALSQCKFINCVFKECDLSNAMLNKTGFQEVAFLGCKLLGLRFDLCDPFGFAVHFKNCLMDHTSFYKVRLIKTHFTSCRMREADFTEADLRAARFENCDLLNAVFDQSILEKTDFTTAYDFTIDPESNKIKGAKFASSGLRGLLEKYGLEIE